MPKIGEVIIKHRKIKGMTQKEVADKLHVSPQAVSKWERNLSEPDLQSIRDLAILFDISVDEFLNLELKETVVKEEVLVNKYMCDVCRELYTKEDLKEIGIDTTCNSCFEEREKKITDFLEKDMLKNKGLKPFIIGGIIGLSLYLFLFLIFIFSDDETLTTSLTTPLPIVLLTTTFLTQLLYDSWLRSVMLYFAGRSIRMPGVIFELSLDGIISLIFIKLLLTIVSIIFTLFIAAIGLFIAIVISPISYVVEIIRAIYYTRKEVSV